MEHPCPTCSEGVPEESVWLFNGKFYCSEGCAREAALNAHKAAIDG